MNERNNNSNPYQMYLQNLKYADLEDDEPTSDIDTSESDFSDMIKTISNSLEGLADKVTPKFNWVGYDNEAIKTQVLSKLNYLREILNNSVAEKYTQHTNHLNFVLHCIDYVDAGAALTPSTAEILNQIYNEIC